MNEFIYLLLQAELGVYEELWDSARLLTEAEAKPLERMFGDKTPEDSLVHFLKVQSHSISTMYTSIFIIFIKNA